MDYLGTTDYLTSPVSGKVEAWTHYNEWGLITHNAVLKCGQRELDLVKRYATHDYDSVLELYYAKARFYDAHDRRFTAVDPILDPSQYDLREYVQNPVQFVQYLYVQNQPLIYIDPTGEVALTTTIVYAGTIFTVASLQAWFNTPSGKKAISTASGVIADAITYTGKGISNFVSGVISGTVGFVRTLVIVPPVNMKVITGEVLTGATQATAKVLTQDIEKNAGEYMDKAGCEDDEESDSNPKSGNQKNDQSSSKPNSQGKDQSASNANGPKKSDGGNGVPPKPIETLVDTKMAANRLAEATDGTITKNKNGYTVRIPNGKRDIVVRFENAGSGGRTVPYYRISVDGKGSYTVNGVPSNDRALTHIDLTNNYLAEILNIITKIRGGG